MSLWRGGEPEIAHSVFCFSNYSCDCRGSRRIAWRHVLRLLSAAFSPFQLLSHNELSFFVRKRVFSQGSPFVFQCNIWGSRGGSNSLQLP